MKEFIISVDTEGKATMIYDDAHADLMKEAQVTIERVSNVEPVGDKWWAFMNDGTKLGPYNLRQEALDGEVRYLQSRLFGSIHAPTDKEISDGVINELQKDSGCFERGE